MYLELAGDARRSEHLAATMRSMVCYFWRSDNAFSTGAFGQVCIAVRRVLLGRLSQGQDRCPSLQFHTGGGGFDSPLARPSGLDYPAHCAASETSLVRAPMLEPHPRPCTAPALTTCCLPSRLAGCSSSPPRTTTILGSLGISGASCTNLRVHIWRADASVGTESARRVEFARVDGQGPGLELGPVRTAGAYVECLWHPRLVWAINVAYLGVGPSL